MRGQATRVIEIYCGQVVIADPGYDKGCRGYFSHAAKKGDWMTYIEYDDSTGTPCFLGAVHLDYENSYLDLPDTELDDVLGVDSGQMSIYDKEEYDYAHEKDRFNDFYDDVAYGYDRSGKEGSLSEQCFYADNFGIATRTHYGDGCCYATLFTEGEGTDSPIVAIEIDLC